MVTEPPPHLLPYSQLLLTGQRVPPITVLIMSSSTTAAPPVQDGSLGVVRHWVVNGADVRNELKIFQDMSRQFGLVN